MSLLNSKLNPKHILDVFISAFELSTDWSNAKEHMDTDSRSHCLLELAGRCEDLPLVVLRKPLKHALCAGTELPLGKLTPMEKTKSFKANASINYLIKNEKVIDLFKELVESFNKFFNHAEQIKKFELMPDEWSVESGEMTPKLSMKRKVIMEKYKDAIERIYQ